MKTYTSISGGKSSAYIAAHYPADYLVFALVRTSDTACKYPDEKLRRQVEDRIQMPFVGTLEDDIIIHTILNLEQYLGKKIYWVSGMTFDEVIEKKRGWLPNKLHRYCTAWLKVDPIFYWWAQNIGDPVGAQIGFRANEVNRANKMLDRCNEAGLIEYKATFEKNARGQNKWENIPFQKPLFPLIENRIYRDDINRFWEGRPVRFAPINNCVHCFHKNPVLLNAMADLHPNKMKWAAAQEGGKNGNWRSDASYNKIMQTDFGQLDLYEDFTECDNGYCGL